MRLAGAHSSPDADAGSAVFVGSDIDMRCYVRAFLFVCNTRFLTPPPMSRRQTPPLSKALHTMDYRETEPSRSALCDYPHYISKLDA